MPKMLLLPSHYPNDDVKDSYRPCVCFLMMAVADPWGFGGLNPPWTKPQNFFTPSALPKSHFKGIHSLFGSPKTKIFEIV
jgi:hypothetical protein